MTKIPINERCCREEEGEGGGEGEGEGAMNPPCSPWTPCEL